MNKSDRQYLAKVASMGCQLCHEAGYPNTPAQIHHLREGAGMGQRGGAVLPLCRNHHQGGFTRLGCLVVVGFHHSPAMWRELYGTEREVLARFLERMERE